MSFTKIILAGPGTGKTTKVKELIKANHDAKIILVLSFTNATVCDLLNDFKQNSINIDSDKCMTLHKYALRVNHLPNWHILNENEKDIMKFYSCALGIEQETLQILLKCITFDGMIKSCADFIKDNPVYAKEKIGDIDLLIIDEYQDFNENERKFIEIVAGHAKDTIILGDDDQCIYGFKDADIDGIHSVYNDSRVEKINHQNTCYRCPDSVVKSCNNLIGKNVDRIRKTLIISNKKGDVVFEQKINASETNNYVIEQINTIKKNDPQSAIMILSPVFFAVETLIEDFKKNNIDFTNWFINRVSLEMLRKIWAVRAIFGSKKILNILFLSYELRSSKASKFKKLISIAKDHFQYGKMDDDTIREVLGLKILSNELCGYIEITPNFDVFFKNHPDYSELYVLLSSEADKEKAIERLELLLSIPLQFEVGKVNVMSIHKSKGLQADYIFILALVEGILPNEARGVDSIETQRRLLFVGMSRARKRLYLISTVCWEGKNVHKVDKTKFKYDFRRKMHIGQTSSFIKELGIH